jgi:hypothetical protein
MTSRASLDARWVSLFPPAKASAICYNRKIGFQGELDREIQQGIAAASLFDYIEHDADSSMPDDDVCAVPHNNLRICIPNY